MATLYAFKFNNYYNRRLKRFTALVDYPEPEYLETGTYCNFNPNDGINTEIILGRPGYNNYKGDCDYFIYSDDNVNITSRWFIIEQTRKMGDQYKVLLHRDVIADNLDKILSSECFIEKATLQSSDPLIFNEENMTANQIKKQHNLIKDNTNIPWLVLYYAKNIDASQSHGTVNVNDPNDVSVIDINTTLAEWQYSSNISKIDGVDYTGYLAPFYGTASISSYRFNARTYDQARAYAFEQGPNVNNYYNIGYREYGLVIGEESVVPGRVSGFYHDYMSSRFNYYDGLASPTYIDETEHTPIQVSSFLDYNGKLIRTIGGEVYLVNIVSVGTLSKNKSITTGSLFTAMQDAARASNVLSWSIERANEYSFSFNYSINDVYKIELTRTLTNEITWDIRGDKLITIDAPYNIIAIPYGIIDVIDSTTTPSTTITTFGPASALALARSIQTTGSDSIYDAQLLPFCPVQDMITNTGGISVTNSKQISYVTKGVNKVGIIINVPYGNFHFTKAYSISSNNNPAIKKFNNQFNLWRLCSPNYANYFDFSVEKNEGIDYFDIDCEYKPYTPYIHLNPNFKGLYGADYNTPLGLVCGGDFSISSIKDAWATYQLQNKNYQLTFDRSIQNLDVQHKYNMIESGVSVAAGTISGAVSGGVMGTLIGAVPAGAIAGGLASLLGGAADMQMKQALYNEALDYKKDMFNYQLGNIQALPLTLSKVTAYNPNNQVFPVLEFYTCTDKEKQAILNKLAWNGMSVGIIDKIQNYINNSWSYEDIEDKGYIKARLIRFEDAEEDFHNVNAIADELFKGVYFK